jgi:hypothetical protein
MKTDIVKITPEDAKKYLGKNYQKNRKLRSGVVSRYARDMKNGNWGITHQGIAFNTRGELIDGQHRLAAIVECGEPITMMVVRDVSCASFSHLDLGFNRTTEDVLCAEGDDWVTRDHISIARLLSANGNSRQSLAGLSPFELKELVYLHRNAISFVLQSLERRIRGVTVAPLLAAIASAYYAETDRVRLAEFIQVLVSGIVGNPETDGAAILLRDFAKDNSSLFSTAARIELYLKTQRAIKAFMKGERISRLYMPPGPLYVTKNYVTKNGI